MSAAMQLTTDGCEVPHALVVAIECRPLSGSQRAILAVIAEQGWISPKQAGRLTHQQSLDRRERYESSDGTDALKRLARRGLVRHRRRGVWVATSRPDGLSTREGSVLL